MYVYFEPFFVVFYGESICGIETSCDYGFWRTLQSSKVLNTVFTTSVLVVIFLHSLSISSLKICLSLARPATQKLTRVTITRGLYQPEPSKFLNFQKNQNFEKKMTKSQVQEIKFSEKKTFPRDLYRFYRSSYRGWYRVCLMIAIVNGGWSA